MELDMYSGKSVFLDQVATEENFSEEGYLYANPDVKAAVLNGTCPSGATHFETFGKKEGRRIRNTGAIEAIRLEKMRHISEIVDYGMPHTAENGKFNFLTDELKSQFDIISTDAVSSNDYDPITLSMIEEYKDGIILDCGSGRRGTYYDNVVNYEIVDYDTTDVIGVGERLPFKDNVFDAVISIAVLEHVKDPFQCAREITRVMKPGGKLICCVPFLQPLHGYPHHYYNMSHQGLRALFSPYLRIDRQDVLASTLPIWSLSWMLQSWAQGLSHDTRQAFLDMRIGDLVSAPQSYLNAPFVTELSLEKNFELASATSIFAHKPE